MELALIAALARLVAGEPAMEPPATEAPAISGKPTISPAQLDDTLDIQGKPLPAREVDTRLALSVWIAGRGPFRFLVDSGADRSVIGTALAEQLRLPQASTVTLHSIAGTSTATTVVLDGVQVGDVRVPPIAAPAMPERFLGAQGILGIDALADQRLMLDFEQKTITIQDARRRQPAGADEIVVTARRRRGQLILTQVRVNGVSVYAIIDTGSDITVGNPVLLERVFRGRHPPPGSLIEITSVTGQTVAAQLLVFPRFAVGSLLFEKLPVAFANVPLFALFGLQDQPAVLLGTDALQGFRRVSLDFRARKVRFQLRR